MILVATEAYSQQPTSNPSVWFVLFVCFASKSVCVCRKRGRGDGHRLYIKFLTPNTPTT